MEKHDWPAVMAALTDWLEESMEEEPHAVNFHAQLEEVIAGLPDEAFA